jgi:hypothetical protein
VQLLVRIVVGIVGVLSILLVLRFLLDPTTPAASLGVTSASALGAATLRGDFAGFFGVCGIFALAAAMKKSASLLIAPLLAIAIALTGRIVSYAIDGGGWPSVQPMLVEFTLLIVFALGRVTLAARRT